MSAIVTFDFTDQAKSVAGIFTGNDYTRRIYGPSLTLGDDALAHLSEQPSDYDGHYDGHAVWVGGTAYPVDVVNDVTARILIWSIARPAGASVCRAVDPGIAGVDVPAEVLEWAEGHGLSVDDPDVVLLVAPGESAQVGDVPGEIDYLEAIASASEVEQVVDALDDPATI